jgi:hypothetical protein
MIRHDPISYLKLRQPFLRNILSMRIKSQFGMSNKNPHSRQQVSLHSEMWGCGGLIAVDRLQKVSHNLFMQCEACLQAEGGQSHFLRLLSLGKPKRKSLQE